MSRVTGEDMELGGKLPPGYAKNKPIENTTQRFRDLYHAAEGVIPGLTHGFMNAVAQPPANATPQEREAFHQTKMDTLRQDAHGAASVAMQGIPPVYLGDKVHKTGSPSSVRRGWL